MQRTTVITDLTTWTKAIPGSDDLWGTSILLRRGHSAAGRRCVPPGAPGVRPCRQDPRLDMAAAAFPKARFPPGVTYRTRCLPLCLLPLQCQHTLPLTGGHRLHGQTRLTQQHHLLELTDTPELGQPNAARQLPNEPHVHQHPLGIRRIGVGLPDDLSDPDHPRLLAARVVEEETVPAPHLPHKLPGLGIPHTVPRRSPLPGKGID
mmetsp:Transcript_150210/g.262439  ORF Transcript_150210/g.262439 Transcript_150210/m.262439 type:complete len:206 (+) Transcript_150210:409-1026(+)